MTEDDARGWCERRFSTEQVDKLAAFGAMVVEENARQNLISPVTCASMWGRHLTDSAQLVPLAMAGATSWLDVGSGAGFPGIVLGILWNGSIMLVEPRAKRAQFLDSAARQLGLSNVAVTQAKAESVKGHYDVISARAVASLPDLLAITRHLRDRRTQLILPRGRNGASEVEQLPRDQRRMFHVEHSVTDAQSVIAVADGVTD